MTIEGASHRYDRLKTTPHHWIEEGTEDDFKWNIINSDLPVIFMEVADDYQHFEVYYHTLSTSVNKKLIEALLARPEVVKHEPQAATLGA